MDRDRIEELVDELIDDRSVEALERLTGSSDDRVLAALVEVAGKIIDGDRADDDDDTIVEEIQAHLVKCAKTGPLIDALDSKNPSVRELALGCLGEIGDLSAAEHMIGRLEDAEASVREAALEHLTLLTDQDFGMDPPAWRKWLVAMAENEKARVQEAREELKEKRQRKSKVIADIDEDAEDASDSDDDDDKPRRRSREDDDEDSDESEVAKVERDDAEDDF
jgi:hypothetical protein